MIDRFLNKLTTYQLILYYLAALLALGIFFSGVGWVPVNPLSVLETVAGLVLVCLGTNLAFSKLLKVTTNQESTLITALILALVLGPVSVEAEPLRFGYLMLGGVFAVASKYLLVWRRHHIFNPVALGIVLTGFAFNEYASWWVGQWVLLPAVVIGGLLLARKTNRLRFVALFGVFFVGFLLVWDVLQGLPWGKVSESLTFTLFQSEVPFFVFAMVTEPLTSPKRWALQVVFLAVAAVLSLPQFSIGPVNFSPELALVVANLVGFLLGPQRRYTLVLKSKRTIALDTIAFAYHRPRGLKYEPGQYLELTLPLTKSDRRGNRRYLSFASSPTEEEILIVARFPKEPSAFKQLWKTHVPGDTVLASEISGDFVLPRQNDKKVALISGGIGVTPFRSMIQAIIDTEAPRDLVLVDAHSKPEHRVFADVFDHASQVPGVRVVHADTERTGRLDASFLSANLPDLKNRTFYLSGSPGFVDAVKKALRSLKVSRFRIRSDFFPGY